MALSQISQVGGQGCKHKVEAKYLCHGNRHIGGRLEGVFSVEGEVPKNGKDQGNQIGNSVILDKQLKDRKATDLNNAGRN